MLQQYGGCAPAAVVGGTLPLRSSPRFGSSQLARFVLERTSHWQAFACRQPIVQCAHCDNLSQPSSNSPMMQAGVVPGLLSLLDWKADHAASGPSPTPTAHPTPTPTPDTSSATAASPTPQHSMAAAPAGARTSVGGSERTAVQPSSTCTAIQVVGWSVQDAAVLRALAVDVLNALAEPGAHSTQVWAGSWAWRCVSVLVACVG